MKIYEHALIGIFIVLGCFVAMQKAFARFEGTIDTRPHRDRLHVDHPVGHDPTSYDLIARRRIERRWRGEPRS